MPAAYEPRLSRLVQSIQFRCCAVRRTLDCEPGAKQSVARLVRSLGSIALCPARPHPPQLCRYMQSVSRYKVGGGAQHPKSEREKKKIHCDPKFPWRARNRQTYLRCWRSAGAAQWPSSSPLVCPTCQPKAPHMCSCGMAGHGVSQAPEFQGACSHPATVQRESRAAFVRRAVGFACAVAALALAGVSPPRRRCDEPRGCAAVMPSPALSAPPQRHAPLRVPRHRPHLQYNGRVCEITAGPSPGACRRLASPPS